MKIKDLSIDDRPREKLLMHGSKSLSKAELIAILIRTGTGNLNAVDTARMLLDKAGNNLNDISAMSVEKLCMIDGIGPGKAVSILAAIELGKRFMEEVSSVDNSGQITSPTDVYRLMYPVLKGLKHEECWTLLLNRANKVIAKLQISSGGLSETTVDSRMIIKSALEQDASAVILIHNHPSGNPMPGSADIKCTIHLKEALKTFDMSLVDHIVFSDSKYYSFADEQIYLKDI